MCHGLFVAFEVNITFRLPANFVFRTPKEHRFELMSLCEMFFDTSKNILFAILSVMNRECSRNPWKCLKSGT